MSQSMNKISQQVNLYQSQFRPEKERMTLAHCLVILLLVTVIFGGLSWLKVDQLKQIEQQVADQENQHQTMLVQLSKLAATRNEHQQTAVKEIDITVKEEELKARRELLDTLTGGKLGSTEGFSDYLLALSRQHVSGAWITGLSVQQGGMKLAIAGSSLKPELAPVYLQNLSKEKIFAGKTFGAMELSRQDKVSEEGEQTALDLIDFIFRTGNDDMTQVEEIKNES